MRSTGQRGWLAASHEKHAHGSPVSSGAGSETSTRSWLRPGASAQPRTNSPHPPKRGRAWLDPSATEQPQATCGSLGSRACLYPSASAQPQAKRKLMEGPVPAPPVSSERHLHLGPITLMMATGEVDHLAKYALNGMDSARVKRVLNNPCKCTANSKCRACQLPLTSVMDYCERFHHLSEECQTH